MKLKALLTIMLMSLVVSLVFLGTSIRSGQVEAYHTDCIWPYSGGFLIIEYRWGNNLSGPSLWKTAFETSSLDWSSRPTVVRWQHDANGQTTYNTYNLDDGWLGYNTAWCANGGAGERVMNDTWGNVYYDDHTANERRSITGHELGHAVGLYGFDPYMHSTNSADLMYATCCPSSTRYTPVQGDDNDVNDHY